VVGPLTPSQLPTTATDPPETSLTAASNTAPANAAP